MKHLDEAQDPSTSHARLRELSKQSPELAMAILANPNTPLELAAQLRKQLMGQPDDSLDAETLAQLEKEASTQSDPARLEWLSHFGGYVTRAVARNPHTPSACLRRLGESADMLVRCELLRNPAVSGKDIRALLSNQKAVQRAVAACPRTPQELLLSWTKEKLSDQTQRSLAQNPSLPLLGLIQLWLGRQNGAVRLMEASIQARGGERAQRLAPWLGKLRGLSRVAAWRSAVVQEALRAEECAPKLRETLFQLSQMPTLYLGEAELKQLVSGSLDVVDLQMTRRYDAPPEYLTSQAANPNASIRAQVAAHNKTSLQTLETLAEDAELSVRLVVARNPRTPAAAFIKMAEEENLELLTVMAQNARIPPLALDKIVSRADEPLRLKLAMNRQLSPQTQLRLSKDTSRSVRQQLAALPRLSVEALQSLASDQEPSIRRKVSRRPDLSPGVLATLARDAVIEIRREVAARSNADEDTLSRLGKDRSKYVRLEVAKNPRARLRTLQRLTLDKVSEVVKAAEETAAKRT